PDNSFAPNQPINRAEAVSILNNMLNRQADITKLAIYQNWPDNPENAWFYADLLEAVHTHTYIIENDTEIWLEIYPTQH
ncbi:MAG: S-layer homology domain-containing protein, partial [Firmicutes bacterium]|nr:S-layer homology domain-containing protein [Bacillota bacterium]